MIVLNHLRIVVDVELNMDYDTTQCWSNLSLNTSIR